MRILSGIGTTALLLVSACQPDTQLLEAQPLTGTVPADPAADQIRDVSADFNSGLPSRSIVFRQGDGTPEFSLQFKPTGGKLIDRKDNVIANFVLKGNDTIQITDTRSKTIGYVSRAENTWQIENPKRSKTLFTFRREANGRAALLRNSTRKDSDSMSMYELTATEDGYTVASGKSEQYMVSNTKGVGQLKTSDGQTVIATDGDINLVAIASFGFTQLTQAQQAGLAYALSANVL